MNSTAKKIKFPLFVAQVQGHFVALLDTFLVASQIIQQINEEKILIARLCKP